MTKNAVAIVYKRNSIKTNNAKDRGVTLFTYTLEDIITGYESIDFNKKTFFSDDDTQFPYIENIMDLSEEFVYAFPYYTTANRDKQYEVLEEVYTEAGNDDYTLVQLYRETDTDLTTLATRSNEGSLYTGVNPSNYDGFKRMLNAEYYPLRKGEFVLEGTRTHLEENPASKKNVNMIVPKIDLLKTDDMFAHVTKTVVCQDEQVKAIVTGFAKNQRIISAVEENPDKKDKLTEAKQNFFVCGPTGVGKTAIFRSLAKYANVPIIFEDATRYTMEGYVGESPETVLKNLLRAADYNIALAQRGIIIMDEIDKKASSSHISPAATTEVQSSFLTMMSGQEYPVNVSNSKGITDIITFDTSTVTFAFLGAYSGIEAHYNKGKNMGFGAEILKKGQVDDYTLLFSPENLIKYGMVTEFLGRGNIVALNGLNDVESMCRIILESDKSPATVNKELYALIGINLILHPDAVAPLAKKAISYKAGARGIKKAFDEILGASEFDIFSNSSPKEITITPESVEDPKKLLLKY